MSSPRKLNRYPFSYWTLMRRAHESPVRITCDDSGQAKLLRMDLYNFRTALRRSADDGGSERVCELRILADQLSFSVNGRMLLVYTPQHYTRLIEGALSEFPIDKSHAHRPQR